MTDHNADDEIKNSGNHSEDASLVPDSTVMVIRAGEKANASAGDHGAEALLSSKDIVLQRLTPHSSWEDFVFNDKSEREDTFNASAAVTPEASSRRLSVMAIVAIAASVGAIGGALATVGVGHFLKNDQATAAVVEQRHTVESALAKINADIAAFKTSSTAQSAKISERVERIEKAQAEPAAKLAKLSEAVEKLRASEATGSVAPPAPAPVAQPNRLPIVDGWVLRDVSDGAATVQGRQGIFEVIPGDPLPGVGRVDAIRRQDGRWVVVTSRGLIVAR